MNVELAQELLNELGSSLEDLEAGHAALFEFLKDKGVVTDEAFAPYLSKAQKASTVRWRAARARLEYLISAEKLNEERAAEKAKEQGKRSDEARPSQGEEKKDEKKEDQKKEGEKKEGKPAKDEGERKAAPQGEDERKNDEGKDDEGKDDEGKNRAAEVAGAPPKSEKDKK